MAKRRFNWIVAIVLIIALAVLVVTAFGLRNWQKNRMAYTAREIGLKAYEDRNWEQAAENLGRYLGFEQADVQILLKYAESQLNIRPLKRSNIQQAMATYRVILRLDRSNPAAAERLVELYLQMDIAGEAELIARRCLQTNENLRLRRMLAISLAEQRKFEEAAAQLQAIVEEHPEQLAAYEILGRINEENPQQFTAEPLYWFNEAVRNNPSSALAFIMRAAFHLRSVETAKAVADLEEAEKLDLSDLPVQLRLAKEFLKANMLDKAQTHLSQIAARDAAEPQLWQTWAELALKTQSKEQMFEVAQRGLRELASEPWDFMPQACELFIRCGRLALAEDCLDRLKQKDIEPVAVAFLEGLLAEAQKQDNNAIQLWHKAMQLGDKSERLRLTLARAYCRTGNYQSAVLQLRGLVSDQPYSFLGHFELARLLAQTGSWAKAAEQARLALEITPDQLDAVLLHIQARIQLNADSEADIGIQQWQDIERQLSKLDELTGGALKVKLLQFQLALHRREFADAEQILTALKAGGNSQLEPAMAEVDLLAARGQIDQAIEKLYILTDRFAQTALPVEYLATLLAGRNDQKGCEQVIKNAIRDIEDPAAKRDLGLLLAQFYNQWGLNDESCRLLGLLSQQLPNDIPVKRHLLRCGQVIKDTVRTQQLVDDIKTIEGQDGWQWRYEQASIWFAGDDFNVRYSQAVALLKENLLANPDDQTSRVFLAAAYERAGELQLAAAMYRQALNRSPEDIHIISATVALMYKLKEYEQADEILDRLAAQKLTHPRISRLKLQSCIRQGDLSSAENILEDLIAQDPDNQAAVLSLALLKMRQKDYDQARELLSKLEAKQPNSLAVAAASVELNIRQEKTREALALCDEMIRQFGNASVYILRARTYAVLGRTGLAKEDFEHATAVEPENTQAWVIKSDFNRSTGHFKEAVEDIQKALMLNPDNLQIQKRAIELLSSCAEPDKIVQGREILEKALSSSPEDIELWLYKARWLLARGTAPAAEEALYILQRITAEQPKNANAWALWAQTCLDRSQLGKATDVILRGLTYSPNDKRLLLLKARAEAGRSPVLAIPTLKLLCEREPLDIDIALELADMYIAAGQCDRAVTFLQQILPGCKPEECRKIDMAQAVALYKDGSKTRAEESFEGLCRSVPYDAKAFLAYAGVLKEDQRWDKLADIADSWFRHNPDGTGTLVALAGDLAATKDHDALKVAEDLLRRVLNQDSANLSAINMLAILLQTTGRSAESAVFYNRLLAAEPGNVIAINNLAWLMCEEQGEYQQALELARQGLKRAPEYADLIDTCGVIYYRLGRYRQAVENFERCIELYQKDSPCLAASYFHLARTLAALGQNSKAVENLRKALDLNAALETPFPLEITKAQNLLQELLRKQNHVLVD
jgi:tetratricopeptide (TPR) repeat protein